MSKPVTVKMLVKTSVEDNNNKFWEGSLLLNGDVVCRWGRVGASGQTKTFPGAGENYLLKKVREKEAKGYKEIKGVGSENAVSKVAGAQLTTVAKKQIKYNSSVVEKLIDYLVKVNRHDIVTASGGKLVVDVDSGLIKTEVGVVVTQDTLDRARDYLVALSNCVSQRDFSSKTFISNLNEYLMCVPQKVGSRRGWEKAFLPDTSAVQRQSALIDSMESTLKAIASASGTQDTPEEEVFNVELTLMDDKSEINRIDALYKSTQKSMHVSSHLRVANVYSVHIATMAKAFENYGKTLTPHMELWHGTRAANLLSILKSGLVIPPSNAAHCTGRLFGDGIYFSDQSTKSLNYSYGYWDGGQRDSNCFMFLADVAMGKMYTPAGGIRKIPPGYNSCFAKAGQSGVVNNEMIVYDTRQCNLVRLIEFIK